jgi:hypothetical protein
MRPSLTLTAQPSHTLTPDSLGDALVADLAQAADDGLDIEDYLAVRAVGQSDDQTRWLLANRQIHNEVWITNATTATHGQAIVVGADPKIMVPDYLAVRKGGYTHDNAVAVATQSVDAQWYVTARHAGVTHAEALAVGNSPALDHEKYQESRKHGYFHEEAVRASRLKRSLRIKSALQSH